MNDATAVQSFAIDRATFGDRVTPNGDATPNTGALQLSGITRHNLNNVSVWIPLNRLVCITGVSGSGKTTLVREVLLPAMATKLKSEVPADKASDRLAADGTDNAANTAENEAGSVAIEGWEHLKKVVLVDQSVLAKTPRSNPAVYIGAFDEMRELFAQSAAAKRRGLTASAFSFNSSQGQCERCRGAGFEKIEMQFLSDVFVRCPDCNGRRYRSHILEIKIAPPEPNGSRPLSIGDLLDATVDEAIDFLSAFHDSRPAQRAAKSLGLLQEAGLGYLSLGQPINTLSGGESQRLKLVRHLADAAANEPAEPNVGRSPSTLFLFDEPTTGLHFEDVGILLNVFQRLVNAGHSVVVIEHNIEMVKSADWVIDLGPDAGDEGGRIVAAGTPEEIAACPESHTGKALREVLGTCNLRTPAPIPRLTAGVRY